MIHFDAEVIYNDGFNSKTNPYDRNQIIEPKIYLGEHFFGTVKQNKGYRASVCTYIYKNQFLKQIRLNFYEGILHEDGLFTTKAIISANRILYLPKKYFFRRMRSGSIMTSKKNIRNIIGYYTVAEELYKYYVHNLNKLSVKTRKILLRTIAGHYSYCNRMFLKLNNKDVESYKIIEEVNKSIKLKSDIYNKVHSKLLLVVNSTNIYIRFNHKCNILRE